MNGQILQFTKDTDRYIKKAEECIANEDFTGALGFLYSALSVEKTPLILSKIADTYCDIGVFELSNKFWFHYMDIAPKDQVSVAYEELAINYFYMDDYLSSSYYFHKKLTEDGYISKEGLDQEIIDFFSGEELKRGSYHIAYPFNEADYSYKAKVGKRSLAMGDFAKAVETFNSIPKECWTEEIAGDLAVAYLMDDLLDQSLTVSRHSLAVHGDNVTAYCNMSTVYDMKEDFEKSEYYYKRALECCTGAKNEEYRIATCAIERLDHKRVNECLEKILEERPFDLTMRFFYGLSFLNLGSIDKAKDQILCVYRLNPSDPIFRYYAKFVSALDCDAKVGNRFKYLKVLPEEVEEEYKKVIDKLSNSTDKSARALKNERNREILEWGLKCADKDVARMCVYVLATAFNPYAKNTLLDLLLDVEVDSGVKRVIVYALTIAGYTKRFGVVDHSFYFTVKPRKLKCEKANDGGLYLSAYALCLSRISFYNLSEIDKLSSVTDRVYKAFKGIITQAEVNNEEMAGIILWACKFKNFTTHGEIARLFDISSKKFELLKNIFEENNNDKGN